MNRTANARLLIVDDESALMTALCNTLETEGYRTSGFTSARTALAQLREQQFDLLLTDLMMPEMDGIALLRAAQDIDRDLAGIVMTGHGTINTAVEALRGGALDYVLKPFRLDNLLPVLTRALATRRVQTENIRLREAVSIYELSRAITMGLSHDEIVERTVYAAAGQNDAGSVCLLVPTEDGRELRVAGSNTRDPHWAEAERVRMSADIVNWVSLAREQLAAWDGSSAVEVLFRAPFEDPRGGVALPIVASGDLYGVLRFSSRFPQRRLGAGQIKALEILANTAAAAFDAASLVSQLQGLNHELEARVHERTRELEASNADLEAFSYSVSHDLRAPLRAVDGFCDMFIADFGQTVPREGIELLEKARGGAARMNQLIEDLLRFARYSRQSLTLGRISMTELAGRVAAGLEASLRGRHVELRIESLPECEGDATLLEQVLINLLSNAIKFTSGCATAEIVVGSQPADTERIYFVRDNGVGFDMKYASRLFGVFQRLHPQTQFEGTGVGLSIVHRIMTRHGGRVWAQSTPGQGATFYFSIPVRPARHL